MFDINEFKKQVKTWMQDHPTGEVSDLIDFCEELIPPSHFAANKWLVDQTVNWYKHLQAHQEKPQPRQSDSYKEQD